MSDAASVDSWTRRLEHVCAGCSIFRSVCVLESIASTQDAPETRSAAIGTIVTACRQTSGRGRFGRHWADTAECGIATTFVAAAQPAERLALAAAIAAAEAAEHALGAPVGIKWPNDIVVGRRKLAGVLIESNGERALIGIGMNITQREFEGELADRATSLAMLGARCERIDVLAALVGALDRALSAPDSALADGFAARDALVGSRALFATPSGPVEGVVRAIDPMRGLRVVLGSGSEVFLPALSTSVAEWAVARARQV